MEIEFLIIADAVEVVNGKLYMLGGAWSQHRAGSFPSPIRFGIAVGFQVVQDETNQKHTVRFELANASGKQILPELRAEFEVGHPQDTGVSTQRTLLGMNVALPLPGPGKYRVKASVGLATKEVEFDAIFAATQSAAQADRGIVQ